MELRSLGTFERLRGGSELAEFLKNPIRKLIDGEDATFAQPRFDVFQMRSHLFDAQQHLPIFVAARPKNDGLEFAKCIEADFRVAACLCCRSSTCTETRLGPCKRRSFRSAPTEIV